MVAARTLGAAGREQLSDARLLLESAVHNARIIERLKGELDEESVEALKIAASQAAQAAAALRRVQRMATSS